MRFCNGLLECPIRIAAGCCDCAVAGCAVQATDWPHLPRRQGQAPPLTRYGLVASEVRRMSWGRVVE